VVTYQTEPAPAGLFLHQHDPPRVHIVARRRGGVPAVRRVAAVAASVAAASVALAAAWRQSIPRL